MSEEYKGERRGFAGLEVWQIARKLVVDVYRVTSSFPSSEQYGMTSQLRRAVVSVPCNIAEGWGRKADGDFIRFLRIARGSLNEVETLLILAKDLAFIADGAAECEAIEGAVQSLERKLYNLILKIQGNVVRETPASHGDSAEDDLDNPDQPDDPFNPYNRTSRLAPATQRTQENSRCPQNN